MATEKPIPVNPQHQMMVPVSAWKKGRTSLFTFCWALGLGLIMYLAPLFSYADQLSQFLQISPRGSDLRSSALVAFMVAGSAAAAIIQPSRHAFYTMFGLTSLVSFHYLLEMFYFKTISPFSGFSLLLVFLDQVYHLWQSRTYIEEEDAQALQQRKANVASQERLRMERPVEPLT